jgi:hypothetical protein
MIPPQLISSYARVALRDMGERLPLIYVNMTANNTEARLLDDSRQGKDPGRRIWGGREESPNACAVRVTKQS